MKTKYDEIKELFTDKDGFISVDMAYKFFVDLLLEMKSEHELDVVSSYLAERGREDGHELEYENGHELDPKIFQQYANEPELAKRVKPVRKFYADTTKDISKEILGLSLRMRNGKLFERLTCNFTK